MSQLNVASNEIMDFIVHNNYDKPFAGMYHDIYAPDFRARLAAVLVEKWGAVAAEPDGEDSAGRAKLKLMSEEDVVNRAFKIAGLFYKQMITLEYCVRTGTSEEITKALSVAREIEHANKNKKESA